jgi:hypothetical protein
LDEGEDMPSLDLTSFDFALKEYFSDQRVENAMYRNAPALALIPKDETFVGDSMALPLAYTNPMGRSAAFATAQTNATASKGVKYLLTRARDYGVATIDNETLLSSQSDKGAFMKAATHEIEGVLNNLRRSASIALFRDGTGTIGRVNNSSFATAVLTLGDGAATADAGEVVNFEVGQVLSISSAGTVATLRSGSLTVVAVDRDAGTVTMSGNLSAGVAAIAQNDYIHVQGDVEAKVKGFSAWLVYGGASSTSFFGVDRSVDKYRLGGVWIDGTAAPIEEVLVNAAMRLGREGGEPDYCFLNFDQFGNLEKALGSKVQYVDVSAGTNGQIGFKGIQIAAGGVGPITVLADSACPKSRGFMLTSKDWGFYSLGKMPRVLDTDGLSMLRQASADGVEVRYGYYGQVGCKIPGHSAVIALP